jgi:hypothetical protein
VDKDMNPIIDIKPNPVLKSMKEASMRKQAIFRSLAATRLEKAKLRQRGSDEPSRVAEQLQRKLEKFLEAQEEKQRLISDRGGERVETIEAEFTVQGEAEAPADVRPPEDAGEVRGADAGDGGGL